MAIFFLFVLAQPVSAATQTANQFTVEMWVNPTGSVVSKALAVQNNQIRLYTDASGYVNCAIYTASWQTAAVGTAALPLGTWSHVACTYDKANIRLFINGSAQGTTPAQTGTVNDSGNVWKIGQDAGGTYGDLTGTIDDVRFYNYARTSAQVNEDMRGSPEGSSLGQGRSFNSSVGYWKMDEGSGTTVNNSGSGGSALNGTLGTGSSAPTWSQSGKFGKALSFDGTDDYVSITNSNLNIVNGLSIGLWFKTGTIAGTQSLIDKRLADDSGEFALLLAAGKPTFYPMRNIVGTYRGYNYNEIVNINTWYHIQITWAGGNISTVPKMYLNGVEKTVSQVASGGSDGQPTNTDDTIRLGMKINNIDKFNGSIDELKIYPYALTLDEVRVEYNHGQAVKFGTLSTPLGVGSSSPPDSVAAMYCVPGSYDSCAAPVASWSFDENQGSTVADSSGNNNVGTWAGTGTHWTPGKIGSAGKFNGSDDYVNVASSDSLDMSNSFTIGAWIKIAGLPSWRNQIMWRESYGSNGFRYGVGGGPNVVFWTGQSGGDVSVNTGVLSLNTFYYITLVYTKTGSNTGNVNLYVNGIADGSGSGILVPPTAGIRIGSAGGEMFFNGLIDQVRIYNYARTPAQIAWDYNRGGPVGWWKMDDCSGSVVRDSSLRIAQNDGGTGNDGTLTVGAGGTQTSAGNCGVGNTASAWSNGATGKLNSSLNFDGTDDYVSVGDGSALQLTTQGAISAWIKPVSVSDGYHQIYNKNNPSSPYDGYILFQNNSNIIFRWDNSGATNQITATGVLAIGSWYHVVGVQTGSGLQIYINGNLVQSGGSANTLTSKGYSAQIGSNVNYFSGQIDDVRVYNYALTPTQVKTVYNGGSVVRFGPSTGTP